MFRRFRHKLVLFLQAGILLSGAVGFVLEPAAWRGIAVCVLGSTLAALICGRVARSYLHATLGRLRRVADDIGQGRSAAPIETRPGDDMYKLTTAVNTLATRLFEATREEQRLHEALRRQERLAFLGELGASVAHEVNNPLDGVQNCARILRRSLDDPDRAKQMLDLIESGLNRIELIVRRLLTLGREHVIRPEEEHLADIVEGAVASVVARCAACRVTIVRKLEVADDRVFGDRALLEQVFVNLLLNALDTVAEGETITVTVRGADDARGDADRAANSGERSAPQRDRQGAAARITDTDEHAVRAEPFARDLCVDVADTGPGIPPDVLPHIFEPFFTTKKGGNGTGLGLAIAARIIDAHRGAIHVAPRPGGGTVFTVRIPRAGAEDRSAEEAKIAPV